MYGSTYAFYSKERRLVIDRVEEQNAEDSLIEAFYGSQHLNITASRGDEIYDDARTSIA